MITFRLIIFKVFPLLNYGNKGHFWEAISDRMARLILPKTQDVLVIGESDISCHLSFDRQQECWQRLEMKDEKSKTVNKKIIMTILIYVLKRHECLRRSFSFSNSLFGIAKQTCIYWCFLSNYFWNNEENSQLGLLTRIWSRICREVWCPSIDSLRLLLFCIRKSWVCLTFMFTTGLLALHFEEPCTFVSLGHLCYDDLNFW